MCVYSTSNFVCGHSLSTWQYCDDATYQDVVVREVAREPRSGRFNRTSNSTSRSSRSSTSRSSTSRSPHRHARRRHDPLTSPSSSPTSPTSPGLALSVEGSSSPKEKNPDMEPFSSPPEQQQQRRRSPASPSPNQSSASPPPAFSSPPSSPSFIRDEEAQPEYIRHTARSRTRRRSNSFSSPSPLTTSTSPSREGQPNSPRNHVSRARLPCKHVKRTSKDSDKACSSRFNCNLKRVKNCWTCCQCGHGPNRFVNCTGRVPKDRGNGDDDEENKDKDGDVVMKEEGEGTKEEDATAVFDDDDDKTYCPHMICPECKPLGEFTTVVLATSTRSHLEP